MTSEQFIFTFPQTVQYAADHFLTADCNRDAHRWVTTPSAWHAHTLVLHGPARSGKTHLAHIWAGSAGGMIAEASDLSRDAVPDLTSTDIAIEAVDGDVDQTALFHLYNLTREQGRRLLLTARTPPASWSIDLPDLQSRLSAAPSVAISEPDESLIAPLLVKLFADRQLGIPPDVVMFLAARVERTFGAIEQLVSDLDHAAMQEGRRVTLHLARRTLEGTAEGQR
jgi:chromosomal replication initiation ATPase DnaA